MPTIANSGFFPEKSFVMPGDNVWRADADCDDTARTHVFLDCPSRRDVLDNPLVSAFRFGPTATRRARDVEGRHLVTLGTVAATH